VLAPNTGRIIRGAMEYAYWAVICKTPDCDTRHLAKLIGLHNHKTKYLLQRDLPATFRYECPKCRSVHSYKIEDFFPDVLEDEAPRGGVREWW
jgi:hypothetical protein